MNASPTALFISPHLDDVAFSCGGVAAALAGRGWRTALVTVFTRSVMPATGFALACQCDKGVDDGVDYMALRRDEDRDAARILGFSSRHDLDLPEAPHRGYDSAAALFAPVHDNDHIWQDVATRLSTLVDALHPALVLAPQGLGAHVDHLQVRRVVLDCVHAPVWFYRDTPYAIRNADAPPPPALAALTAYAASVDASLERKLLAAQAYRSQIGFQFGGSVQAANVLRDFARAEAQRAGLGAPDAAAERFLCAGDPFSHPANATLHGVVP